MPKHIYSKEEYEDAIAQVFKPICGVDACLEVIEVAPQGRDWREHKLITLEFPSKSNGRRQRSVLKVSLYTEDVGVAIYDRDGTIDYVKVTSHDPGTTFIRFYQCRQEWEDAPEDVLLGTVRIFETAKTIYDRVAFEMIERFEF